MRPVSVALEHSRAIRLAAGASGRRESELERALESSSVVVSADAAMPGALLTTRVLLTTLRRLPGQLVLERDGLPKAAVDLLAETVLAIDPERPLKIGRALEPTVRLHIGAGRGDQSVRLVPEAHGAHVAGQRTAAIRPTRPASALGAIYTAALGAAEAFKHTAQVRHDRRVLHRHLRFCPVTLSSDLTAAPVGADTLHLELTLVGIGAIGTGIVLILSELGATGRLLAVDYERFTGENRGTYSLGGAAEVAAEPAKVALAKAALAHFDVISFPHRVEELTQAIDRGDATWFPLVVSGLDTPQARRETQRLWPNRLVDAATGDTMLGLHEHLHGTGPCMTCFFPEERGGPSAAERLSAITGLPVVLLAHGDEILREEHLGAVPQEQRTKLVQHLGKPVCGLARALGLTDLRSGDYEPSVPFVSLQAASLAIGRILAGEAGLERLPNLVQYDGLFGPQAATLEYMLPTEGCYCQTNAPTIEKVRALRGASTSAANPG
jgi:hypothetical protein